MKNTSKQKKTLSTYNYTKKGKKHRSHGRLQHDIDLPENRRPREDPRGHHMHRTADIRWCVKCGAYATSGGRSQYLGAVCPGRMV